MKKRNRRLRPLNSLRKMRLVEAIDEQPIAFQTDQNKDLWSSSPFFTYFNLSSVEEKDANA